MFCFVFFSDLCWTLLLDANKPPSLTLGSAFKWHKKRLKSTDILTSIAIRDLRVWLCACWCDLSAVTVFTVYVLMCAMCVVMLPPRSSWACRRPWSPADTRTGRSLSCWCTLRFYKATFDCSVLSTRSHLWAEGLGLHNQRGRDLFTCSSAPSPMQAMRDRSKV